jgi:hypothetical protein
MARQAAKDVVLRVELLGVEPLVWRGVRVPAKATLRELHGVIQLAMGWQDRHLHEYRVGDLRIGVRDQPELEVPDGMESEMAWTVEDVVKAGAAEFEYVYDFGGNWVHRLVLEPATRPRVPGASPLCLDIRAMRTCWKHWRMRCIRSMRRMRNGSAACGIRRGST